MLFAGGPLSECSLRSGTSRRGRSPSRLSPRSYRAGSPVSQGYSPRCRYRLLRDQTSPPLFSSLWRNEPPPAIGLPGKAPPIKKSSAFPDGCSTPTLSASGLALGESLDVPRRPEDGFGDGIDLPRHRLA